MFHLLRFPVCCKQIQNANLKSCYYLVCLSCTYSCSDYAGAINATVSMFQYLYEANTFWGTKHLEMFKCICHGRLQPDCIKTAQNTRECSFTTRGILFKQVHINQKVPKGFGIVQTCTVHLHGCYLQDVYLVLLTLCGHPVVTRCKTKINQCSFQMALSCITESRGSYTVLLP